MTPNSIYDTASWEASAWKLEGRGDNKGNKKDNGHCLCCGWAGRNHEDQTLKEIMVISGSLA
jgi:hypothetical protein